MTDLLTTKQVQALLRVDRTTIYRMVENGQLPALRVGKQWRFAQGEVEQWLRRQSAAGMPPISDGPESRKGSDLAALLPLTCVQLIQDGFADALNVMMVVTDMQGRPITQISNPCGLFGQLLALNPAAVSQCVQTWQQMAGTLSLEPRWAPSETGLLCARGLIRVGSELKGMVVVGGIAPEPWPPTAEQIAEIARTFDVSVQAVIERCDAVYRLDRAAQEKALRFAQRIADIFSHIAGEPGLRQGQAQTVAATTGR